MSRDETRRVQRTYHAECRMLDTCLNTHEQNVNLKHSKNSKFLPVILVSISHRQGVFKLRIRITPTM